MENRIKAIDLEVEVTSFTSDKIKKVLGTAKNGKALGPDKIHMEAMTETGRIASNILLLIYNYYLRKQKFPKEWKKARLVLIQKPGKPP